MSNRSERLAKREKKSLLSSSRRSLLTRRQTPNFPARPGCARSLNEEPKEESPETIAFWQAESAKRIERVRLKALAEGYSPEQIDEAIEHMRVVIKGEHFLDTIKGVPNPTPEASETSTNAEEYLARQALMRKGKSVITTEEIARRMGL